MTDVVQSRNHLIFRRKVGDEHQDVTHVSLFNRGAGEFGFDAVTAVFKEHNVNGTRGAHRRNEVALRAVVFDGLPEDGRQTRGVAPAQITARERIFGLGVGGGKRTEIFAVADAFDQSFGFSLNISSFGV